MISSRTEPGFDAHVDVTTSEKNCIIIDGCAIAVLKCAGKIQLQQSQAASLSGTFWRISKKSQRTSKHWNLDDIIEAIFVLSLWQS